MAAGSESNVTYPLARPSGNRSASVSGDDDEPDFNPSWLLRGILGASRASGCLDRLLWGTAVRNDLSTLKLILDMNAGIDWFPTADTDISSEEDDRCKVRQFLGATAIWVAAEAGSEDIVKILLESGANALLPAADGTTPLQIATKRGHNGVVQLLFGYNPPTARR